MSRYAKHLRECFITISNILMKPSHSRLIYYIIIGVTRRFSTLFSVLEIPMKHSHSRLMYYIMIIRVTRRFFLSLLGVGYPDETLSLAFDILHDNWSYASFFQLSSRCWVSWWNTLSRVWYITSTVFHALSCSMEWWRILDPRPRFSSFNDPARLAMVSGEFMFL